MSILHMSKSAQKSDSEAKILENVGLSENEAVLYSLMLDHPQCTVQELETRAPFPRTMLYYVLKQLMRRELVSAKKETWRTVYIAEDPDHLYDILSQKEKVFERNRNDIRELVPQLKRRYRLVGKRPSVRMFEGVEQYQKTLEDIVISRPREILSYETLSNKKTALEVLAAHERRRISRKILKKVLFFETNEALTYVRDRRYDDFTQFRCINENTVAAFEADVTLYDGKILYTSYYDTHEPTAILVEDQALFTMQRNLFESLWKQAKDRTLAYIEKI
jgi:sugar-specific transcriptional regulator TrmB